MMEFGLDPTAARAAASHVQLTWRAKTARWFAALPDRIRRYFPVASMIGAAIGILIWEQTNTIDGFARIWPERGWLVWVIGIACPIGFMIGFRNFMESFRAKRYGGAAGFGIVTLLLFAVVFFGTFSNFVAETQVAGREAREINQQRQDLIDTIRRMDRELQSLPVPDSLEADRELLKARVAEAAGWKLVNLDVEKPATWDDATQGAYPGPACVGDLDPRPRFLCNDAAAIRGDILKGEGMLAAKEGMRLAIEGKEAELEQIKFAEAGAQYDAMAGMFTQGRDAEEDRARLADFISSWLLLLIALALLVSDALFWDHLLERRERKET
jgi:hypothetical protein